MEEKTKTPTGWRRFIKFVLFSCSAGVIQAGSFTLLSELLRFPYWPSYLVALVLSVLWNFTLNRAYTFHSAANVPLAMAQVGGYYLVFTPLSTWLGNYCVETLHFNNYAVLLVTMVVNMVTEFLFCRFVVYRHSMDTRPTDKRP